MVQHARGPVERDDSAHDEECGRDDAERVPVREPDGQDAASELPRRGVEGVGEPVGYQGAHGPFSIVAADGVEVFVAPSTRSHRAGEYGGDLLDAQGGLVELETAECGARHCFWWEIGKCWIV